MRVARLSLIVFLGMVLIGGGVLINDLRYPPEWDQIHLGMSRPEVERLIGPGGGEWPGWSGPYWEDQGILVRNELYIYFDPYEGVSIITVKRFSIFPSEHQLSTVRAEYAHSADPAK